MWKEYRGVINEKYGKGLSYGKYLLIIQYMTLNMFTTFANVLEMKVSDFFRWVKFTYITVSAKTN